MFKQLRNRLLLLNTAVISIVMLAAFAAIYLMASANATAANKAKLSGSGPMTDTSVTVTDQADPDIVINENGQHTVRHFAAGDQSMFTVEVDESGSVVTVDAPAPPDSEACQRLASQAWQQQRNYAVLQDNGRDWMYCINRDGAALITVTNGTQVTTTQPPQRLIVFLDVTDSRAALTSLLWIFAAVGLVMLFVIAGISLLFANRAIAPVQQAWTRQKQFVADASHELKTPLAVITANADALLSDDTLDERSRSKWLHYIRTEALRMGKLINDMLQLAKSDALSDQTATDAVDLSAAVTDVVLAMEAVAFEKQLTLTHDIAPHVSLRGDAESLRRAVVILLDNALKYTPPQGHISVALTRSHHQCQLLVTNSGEALSTVQLNRLFDRFYRADSARNSDSGGYGLGLPIFKSIVEQHNGKIIAASNQQQGISFGFTLKCTVDADTT